MFAGTTPSRPHVGIGIIEIQEQSGSYEPKNHRLLEELKRVAGEQGCDAVGISGFGNKGVGPDVLINDFATDRQALAGVCLVYTDDRSVAPPHTDTTARR